MKPAGMGRGGGLWHGEKNRGDRIVWITDGIRGTGKLPQAWKSTILLLDNLGFVLFAPGCFCNVFSRSAFSNAKSARYLKRNALVRVQEQEDLIMPFVKRLRSWPRSFGCGCRADGGIRFLSYHRHLPIR